MNQDIPVALEERTTIRKRLKQLRKEGKVPAVVHDHGSPSLHVMGDAKELVKVYAQAGKHHPVQLEFGGKKRLAIIKDAHFEPVKNRLEHVVFQAIKQNEKVTAEVPVVLVGDIPAERKSLIVLKQLDVVELQAFPRDLPDQLEVDASSLSEEGDRLTVADIDVPAGVVITTEWDHPIATVEVPKDQIAEADAAAKSLADDAGKPAEEAVPEATDAKADVPAEK
jgi:large subunit ribosomal protein L25